MTILTTLLPTKNLATQRMGSAVHTKKNLTKPLGTVVCTRKHSLQPQAKPIKKQNPRGATTLSQRVFEQEIARAPMDTSSPSQLSFFCCFLSLQYLDLLFEFDMRSHLLLIQFASDRPLLFHSLSISLCFRSHTSCRPNVCCLLCNLPWYSESASSAYLNLIPRGLLHWMFLHPEQQVICFSFCTQPILP